MTQRIQFYLVLVSVAFALSFFIVGFTMAQEATEKGENKNENNLGVKVEENFPDDVSFSGFESLDVKVLRNPELPKDIALQFSWKLPDSVFQTAYQVLLSSTEQYAADQIGDIWDSGKVSNPSAITRVKEEETFFKDLKDGFYYWRVRVWDNNGIQGLYSEPRRFYLVTGDIFSAINGIPASPQSTFGTATSPHSIRWEFFDIADNETGFAIFDDQNLVIVTTAPNPVSDYYYLEETNLEPNTQYGGRTVRTFNPYGFSEGSASFFPVYTLAATPGTPWVFSISDSDIKFVIEPSGNPEKTQYAVFNAAQNVYLDDQGGVSEKEVWFPLSTWQSLVLEKENGPFTLAVKARNGDRIETAFSPYAVVAAGEIEKEKPLAITLQVGKNIPMETAIAATAGMIEPFIGITSSVSKALLFVSAALFLLGLLALIQYVKGGTLDVFGKIPTLVTSRISDIYENHIDKRFISKGYYSFLAHSMKIALVIFGVNALLHVSAIMFGAFTQAQIREPDILEQFSTASQSVQPHDILTYLVTVRNNLDRELHNVMVKAPVPLQTSLREGSLKALDSSTPIGFENNSVAARFETLKPKERQQFEYTVEVSANDYYGGSVIQNTAIAMLDDSSKVVSNNTENTLPLTPESLVGKLVKLEADPSIYLIDTTAHRRLFESQELYKSWYGNDFSAVQIIPQNILEHYPLGGEMLYNIGSFVRFTGTDHIYKVVGESGSLELLSREEVKQLTVEDGEPLYDIEAKDFSKYQVLF